jgi:hypothetical protein
MLTTVAAVLLAISALIPVNSEQSGAPPGRITIEVVAVNGSGCPAGTALVEPAGDSASFMVSYSTFLAQVGAGAQPTDFRKNCQLNLRVDVPPGFTYGIAQSSYLGFANLEPGATGLQRALYYFQGMSATTKATHTFTGPLSDNWETVDKPNPADIVYSPCGEKRNLNINTELRVTAGTSNPATTSFMVMDTSRGTLRAKYDLAWKTC